MTLKQMVVTFFIGLILLWPPFPTSAQVPVVCQEEYTVQAGDWLSKIAEKYYGDVLAYPAIVKVNNADSGDIYTDIVDPNRIEPGWTLCIPSGDDMAKLLAASSTGPVPAGLALADLGNATYQDIYPQPVTLTGGKYEGEPFVEGGASRPTVSLIENPVGYGDLTGDGQPDAAVLLAENSGGSGTFVYLAVVANQDSQPVNLATTLLGDRVQVNSIKIDNKQLVVDMVQAGPDDPACCPSQQVIKTFELQGDQLVDLSSQEAGTAATPELAGTLWRWDQTLMNNDEKFVPADPNNYMVEFMPDGSVSIQADCNRVSGTYTVDGSALTIQLGPATLAACPEGSLGDQFVAHLAEAAIYSIQGQNLRIDLKFDSGTMQFTAQSSNLAGTSWNVIGHNNGRGGVVSSIIGTQLTATFGPDGNVTGSAGCNDYSASYQVEGDNITIGPAISTMKACAEPEGVMDQETEYLAALGTVASYKIQGNRLELRTSEGSLAVSLEATK